MLTDALFAIAIPYIDIAYTLHHMPICGKSVHDARLFLYKVRFAFMD